MQLPEIHNNNIEFLLNKADLVNETVAQIVKDFGTFGITITFSGNVENAYHELHNQLVERINHCRETDFDRLMSVLYQIDITDNDISKTAQQLPHYNEVEVLAHQIIFRELKKVLFRKYYKR